MAATWTFMAEWQNPDAPGRLFTDAELVITVFPDGNDEQLAVVVDLRFDDDGPYVTGLATRKHPRAGYRGKRTNVSPRDVQRLPLAQYVRAALAYASTAEKPPTPMERRHPSDVERGLEVRPFDPRVEADIIYRVGTTTKYIERGGTPSPTLLDLESILTPAELQPRGTKPPLKWVADEHRRHAAAGRSPAKEIAAALDVPVNRVHQWIHEARKTGRLEPSPNSRQQRR